MRLSTFTRVALYGLAVAGVPFSAPVLAAEKVTISFATRPEQGPGGKFIAWEKLADELSAAFRQNHPDIEVQYVPLTDNWGDKLTVQIPTGTAPDIFEMWGAQATDWGEKGFLLDLVPYVERDRREVDPTDFYPGDYRAGIVLNGEFTGQRYGLPRYTNASVIFFNKTAFDEAGLVTPDQLAEQSGWTWDDLRAAARKLTRREGNKVTRNGYRTFFGDGRFAPWIWGAGGKLFDGPMQVALDRPAAIDGLKYLQAMVWQDHAATFNGAFEKGEIAFREQGSKDLGAYGNAIGNAFEWDIAPLPTGPAGSQGNWAAGDMWGLARTTKHPEAAWQFLKFLTSREGMEIMTRRTGLPPSRFSAYNALRGAYEGRNVVYHLKSASTAQVLPFSAAVRAKDVSSIIDQTIRASLETNKIPIESAAKQAGDRLRALYGSR